MLAALELRIPPPLLTLVSALVMWAGAHDKPPLLRPIWVTPVAAGLLAAGVIIIATAILTLRRARTTVSPTRPDKSRALVTTGVFAVTRNPIYLGATLILLAYATYLWLPQSFVAVPVFAAWIHHFQILPEERALRQLFGDRLDDYMRQTRRWV